ncbi:unnamed protein product [Phytomonas sp. EM1]|nr:unnamed protein product [Phytomonas sp. EM1]|eukprot:CCW64946.1 unnamed protein product [Phytomonas sp. isolate EM1]
MPVAGIRTSGTPSSKIVLLGESTVGKSSIALRFARNEFFPDQDSTVGACYFSRHIEVPLRETGQLRGATSTTVANTPEHSRFLHLQMWDTAGQERYRSLAPIYYRDSSGALVVYDITSSDSFAKAQSWIKELRTRASPTLLIFLIGNKTDLESMRQVPYEDGRLLALKEEVTGFYEISAKDNTNVEQVFQDLAVKLLDNGLTKGQRNVNSGTSTSIGDRKLTLDQQNSQPATSTCCFR